MENHYAYNENRTLMQWKLRYSSKEQGTTFTDVKRA